MTAYSSASGTMSNQKYHTSFLEVVTKCDDFPYGSTAKDYYQLYLPSVDESQINVSYGYMLPGIVRKMPWAPSFEVRHNHPRCVLVADTSNGSDTANALNKAFQDLIDICIEQNLFHVLCKRHSERFAIVGATYSFGSVHIERFATTLFGLTTRGAHLVAYTRKSGQLMVWAPRRSAHLYTSPGMLDTTVAGGVKAGGSPFQTIVDEAHEEASLPADYVREHAVSRGALSHMSVTGKDFPGERGLVNPDFVYVYDIELEESIVPSPQDDEVERFYFMNTDELIVEQGCPHMEIRGEYIRADSPTQ